MVVKKVILYMILLLTNLLAQESLYLIDTLVGKGNGLDERLYYAKGLGDINGDGFSDFVVDSGDSTRIYFGNSEFELKADYSFTGRKLFFPLSDINNDGYDDFILGNNFYYGSALFDTSNAIPFDFPHCFRQSISRKVGNIGDVNGDGYKDFVVSSSYNWCNGYSFVWLYLGGDTVKTEPFVTFYSSPFIEGNSEGSFGTAVTGIGDVNNDGYDDILISDPMYVVDTTARNTGRVLLYYGGEQMDNIADSILTHENGIWFGVDMKNLGDINGDEISDFVITSNDSVKIFFGLNGDKISFTNYGGSIYTQKVSGGDINNDGYNDLLIGNQERTINDEWIGNVSCYLGASVFDTVVDYYSLSEKIYTSYANYLDFIGDYNGDGYDDFFFIAESFPNYDEKVGKLYLYSYKNYTSMKNAESSIIYNFKLYQNYPNPFNPSTIITYQIPNDGFVNLVVYNTLGQVVSTLVDKHQTSGKYSVQFNANNLPSGVYLYKIESGNFSKVNKILLLR